MEKKKTLFAHKNPTKNRKKIIIIISVRSADVIDVMNARLAVKRITFRRPHVSAKRPNKCEPITIPKNGIEPKTTNSIVVKWISQFAFGSIMATLIFSIVAPIITSPDRITIIVWNRPLSVSRIASFKEYGFFFSLFSVLPVNCFYMVFVFTGKMWWKICSYSPPTRNTPLSCTTLIMYFFDIFALDLIQNLLRKRSVQNWN